MVVDPIAALLVGLLVAIAFALFWRRLRLLRRAADQLERRVAELERMHDAQPAARVRFDYNSNTHVVRLHLTNDGADAEFWATLLIDGDLSGRWEGVAFATWDDSDQQKVRIGTGETRVLRLAQLDLTAFPFAQWEICVTMEDGRRTTFRAMHTSRIGGDPLAHAPTMFLEVSVLSTPQSLERVQTYTVALHAFDAQQWRS